METRLLPAFLATSVLAIVIPWIGGSPANAQEALNTAVMKAHLSTGRKVLNAEGKPAKVYPKGTPSSRVYEKSGIVRINYSDGFVEELPYVALPLLFQKGTDELLAQGSSRDNVEKTAEVLRDLIAGGGVFRVEGHASKEGSPAFNHQLAEDRARKIFSMLVEDHKLEESKLKTVGFGSQFADAPASASEEALQKDRRVLVVRIK